MGLLRALSFSLLALCIAGFGAWLIYAATDSYAVDDTTQLENGLAFSDLEGTQVFTMLLTWLPLLLGTLLTLALRRLVAGAPAQGRRSFWAKAKRALAWQLPPRTFLAGWCGGLSAGEGALVLAWLGLNGWWLGAGLQRNLAAAYPDTWQERLGKAALTFGQMMAPNLMLLFLPVPHTSFVPWLTGLSRNQLIRYHRWLGHGTMWVLTAHAVLYYIYWAVSDVAGGFWANFSLWGDDGSVNNLAGSLAFFCGLALWAAALTWVRRRFYRFFYRCHIVCFLGFFLLSCAHYSNCWLYFAPGLILYAADLALRAGQLGNLTTVSAVRVEQNAGTVTLHMRADKALRIRPLQEVWLLVPSISRFQWHPFSVASGAGDTLTLHVKRYGAWTKRLLRDLRQRKATTVRVAGPIGAEATTDCNLVPAGAWERHEALVLIGGGVGITGLLSLLRALAALHAAGRAAGLPRRVVCVWTVRKLGEFKSLDAPLLEAATRPGGWLDLRLHHTLSQSFGSLAMAPLERAYTVFPERSRMRGQAPSAATNAAEAVAEAAEAAEAGAGAPTAPPAPSPLRAAAPPLGAVTPASSASPVKYASGTITPALSKASPTGSVSTVSVDASGRGARAGGRGAAPEMVDAYRDTTASPYFWSLLRPVQPKSFGAAHLALVTVLAYLGAFCAALLAASYASQVEQWQGGMLFCVLLSAMATGLPFGLAVFPVHALRHARAPAQRQLAAPLAEEAEEACILDKGCLRVRGSGEALPLRQGRPDIERLLRSVAGDCGCSSVGVYAAGPKGLMTSVQLAVSRINADGTAGAYLELHREAVEL